MPNTILAFLLFAIAPSETQDIGVIGKNDLKPIEKLYHKGNIENSMVAFLVEYNGEELASLSNGYYTNINNKNYIITAKHNLYDPNTGILIANRVIYKIGNNKSLSLNLSELQKKIEPFNIHNDIAYIEIDENFEKVNSLPIADKDTRYNQVSSYSFLYEEGNINIYRQEANILQLYESLNDIYLSDLDAINSMSGSPVFVNENENKYFFGIITGRSKNRCEKYTPPSCSTFISPVDANNIISINQ